MLIKDRERELFVDTVGGYFKSENKLIFLFEKDTLTMQHIEKQVKLFDFLNRVMTKN